MELTSSINRLFMQLAFDLNYRLTEDELSLYVGSLSEYGLRNVCQAVYSFIEEKSGSGVFPSILEFERKIKELRG